jgi:hypothetical protein
VAISLFVCAEEGDGRFIDDVFTAKVGQHTSSETPVVRPVEIGYKYGRGMRADPVGGKDMSALRGELATYARRDRH